MALTSGAQVDFTDGDVFKRVTITAPACTPTSTVLVGISIADTADSDDAGWIYVANVITRTFGSFDVKVAALVLGEPGINDEGPNEIISLVYEIS